MIGDDMKMWHASQENVALQVTASNSSSMMAYLDYAPDRNLEPAWTSFLVSPCLCCKMNPSPWRLASVHSRVCLSTSKKERVGEEVSDSLAFPNARSWLGVHTKSFLMLSSGRRGANSGGASRELVDQSKERTQICTIGWCRKLFNCISDCRIRSVSMCRQNEPCKLHFRFCIFELAGVESNFVIKTSLQKLPNVTLMLNDVIVINDCIIHDTSKTRQTIKGFVHTTIVVFRN